MTGIARLPRAVTFLAEPEKRLFDRFFDLWKIDSTGHCPPTMKPLAEQHFGSVRDVENQVIIRVQNKWTLEGALFNPLRAKRPVPKIGNAASAPAGSSKECVFCEAGQKTLSETFYPDGRLFGRHCMTAANAAKYEGKHGLIIFNTHDPLDFSEEELRDYLETAERWFKKMAVPETQTIYPFLLWNCRWRAGSSVEHGHMQMTVACREPYPRVEMLRRAMEGYRKTHGSDYFSDLYQVYRSLGLGFECDDVRLFASLTPFRDKEVFITGSSFNPALSSAFYRVLKIMIERLGVESFNSGALLPPLYPDGRQWDGFPVVIKMIDRQSVQFLPSDISGMAIFAGLDAIASDPFDVAEEMGPVFAGIGAGCSVREKK